jgi:uncharacterized protein
MMTTAIHRSASVFVLALAALAACSRVPDSFSRNQALYLEMRDGVRIAIDVWLPESLSAGEQVPTVMRATRYWRMQDRPGPPPDGKSPIPGADNQYRQDLREIQLFTAARYALVLVDARGSGASFGTRRFELAEDEWRDYGQIVDWIVDQPWSNRRVGAYGVSYTGNTAEMLAANRHAAVKAVAPLFNDFDNFGHLVFPGGLLNVGFLRDWSRVVHHLDRNDLCGLVGLEGEACKRLVTDFLSGVKRVDADSTGKLLAAAVAEHASNPLPFEAALSYEFRDDPFGPFRETNVGYRRSPAGHLPQIDSSGVAMFVRVGWLDAATVDGALGRYKTIANSQRVFIGPWDHGADNDADPFHPADTPVSPSKPEQQAELLAFFDAQLKDQKSGVAETGLTYYTMGADAWTTTDVWPPKGFTMRSWFFGPSGTLTPEPPAEAVAADDYTVDFTATSGRRNRWYTNGGAGDVVYPDRAEADRKLLTYTSAPMPTDVEITGHPLVTFHVASTHPDGAFIVYLEDVAPDGDVTYLTEGQLRAVMRRTTADRPPYWKPGPHRSERRADAAPLVPGEVAEITFGLWATSVLIRQGHRIRVAIAGADADTFLRYPRDGGVPRLSVQRSAARPSRIELPMRPRR